MQLTEEQKEIARLMGHSPEDLQTAINAEAKTAGAVTVMSKDELAVCRAMGVDPADYVEARTKENFESRVKGR